ncbi:MAG: copper resistance protein CopC/CopD, partial [Actinomycetota bacterium]|nr:copper resistance protein CopC/CopD [Actinomycetota bacterium]
MSRRQPPILVLPFIAALLLLLLPGSAAGHAVLESSAPERGANLEQSPPEVSFSFNEPVEASFGAVRVFDTEGNQVQGGEILRPGGSSEAIGVALPPDLPDGVYTATYRVVSADAHPVSGGLVFTVGEGGAASGKTISELIALSDVGPVTQVAFWFDRWAGYLSIAVAVGLIAFLLFVWAPLAAGGGGRDRRPAAFGLRFRRMLLLAAATGLLASLLAVPLQGATAAGTDFWTALKPGVFEEVVDTRFGSVMLLRAFVWLVILGLALAAPALAARPERLTRPAAMGLLVLPALVLAATPALAGHASTQDPVWLLMPSDMVHVVSMAVWTGGLFALILLLPSVTRNIEAPAGRTAALTDFLMRFSTIALACVALIALSGTVQAVVEVNSFPALVDTAFGRAVLIKVVLFLVLIGLGWRNRAKLIPALITRRSAKEAPGRPGVLVRNNLRIEVLLVSVVLAVTAALVSYPPPTAGQTG